MDVSMSASGGTGRLLFLHFINFNLPDPIEVTANFIPIQCYGAGTDVSLSASGGTGDFYFITYLTESGMGISGSPHFHVMIYMGSYTTTATDTNGCQANATYDMEQPGTLVLVRVETADPLTPFSQLSFLLPITISIFT